MAKQSRPRAGETPLRDELFSVEHPARHARALAKGHQLATGRSANSLLAQLDENEEVLQTFNRLTRAVSTWGPRTVTFCGLTAPRAGLESVHGKTFQIRISVASRIAVGGDFRTEAGRFLVDCRTDVGNQ